MFRLWLWVMLCVVGIVTHVAAEVVASEAFVRAKPPASENTAAYLTLKNNGKQAVHLVKATSKSAKSVEIHTHEHVNGVMRMRAVDAVKVEAGQDLVFRPGGLHLMLMGFDQTGDKVEIQLTLSDGQTLALKMPVQATPSTVTH